MLLWLIPIHFTVNMPIPIPENIDVKAKILSVAY